MIPVPGVYEGYVSGLATVVGFRKAINILTWFLWRVYEWAIRMLRHVYLCS